MQRPNVKNKRQIFLKVFSDKNFIITGTPFTADAGSKTYLIPTVDTDSRIYLIHTVVHRCFADTDNKTHLIHTAELT